MLVSESRHSRRIVGRLDRGQNLFDAVLAICRERGVRAGEVRALGSFEACELTEYDQGARVWKPARLFTGGMELLSLQGNVSERDGALVLHAHVTVMRDRDNGVEVLGGHLVSARVFALELVIEAWDDLLLRRGVDPATGLPLWNDVLTPGPSATPPPAPPMPPPGTMNARPRGEPLPAERPFAARPFDERPPRDTAPARPPASEARTRPPAPAPRSTPRADAAAPTWADVAAVSAGKSPVTEDVDDGADALAPGDILQHPTFGRCEVMRIEGGYEFAHVRLKNGRLVRLALDILRTSLTGHEGGRRVYTARVDG